MPSRKSPSRCPLVALEGEIRADAALAETVKDRLVWDARRVREESPGAPILVRETQAAALRVVWALQTGGHDLLTRCRALGELTRALRALGMLRLGGVVGGRSGSALWSRSGRRIPTRTLYGGDRANASARQEQEQAGGEPEDETTDDAAEAAKRG
jgi:hypothetical protein